MQVYVFETEPEALARHMLLLMVLFDASLTARERAEMFLELHGNVLLRQRTADWACEWCFCNLLKWRTWPHSAQPKRHTSPCAGVGVSKSASARPSLLGQDSRCKAIRCVTCACVRSSATVALHLRHALLTHACCPARCRQQAARGSSCRTSGPSAAAAKPS